MLARIAHSAKVRVQAYLVEPIYQLLIRKILVPIYETKGNESAVNLHLWFFQKVLGCNRKCYWPVHFTSVVLDHENIYVGVDAAPGISSNSFVDGKGGVFVDDYAQMAPNVEIYTTENEVISPVHIGKYCRIGMSSKIYPGVVLGDFTTVAAGSVVRESFLQGYCVISGDPATIAIDYSNNESLKSKFVKYSNKKEYYGYISKDKFEKKRKKALLLRLNHFFTN